MAIRTWRRSGALLLGIALPVSLSAQREVSPAARARLDSVFAQLGGPSAPGCAVGVYRNGEAIFARGYGMANLDHGVAVTPATAFNVGSVSKQFTAMAILLLSDRGRISLDDDVRKWVPELPDHGHRITLRHLLHHTSGLPEYLWLVYAAGQRTSDNYLQRDVLALLARQRSLNFAPGAEWEYSNSNYFLLAIVVHRASGLPLREFAAREIFAPLGMTHTRFADDLAAPLPGRATGYMAAADGTWRRDVSENDAVGAGGLYTTVDDLQRWDANFASGRVGGSAVLGLQLQAGHLTDGMQVTSLLGGLEAGMYRGVATLEHGGRYASNRAMIARYPALGFTTVVLCNSSRAHYTNLSRAVADAVFGDKLGKPEIAGPNEPEAAALPPPPGAGDLAAMSGSYRSEALDAVFEISVRNGALFVQRPRVEPAALQPRAPATFVNGSLTFEFVRDTGGRVIAFTLQMPAVRHLVFARLIR